MSTRPAKARSVAETSASRLPKPAANLRLPAPDRLSFSRLQRAVAVPREAAPADIVALQRSYGNQAVQHLLSRRAAPGHLSVGPAGDHFEQEAKRVADQVVGPLAHRAAQTKPLTGAIISQVQRHETPRETQAEALAPDAGFQAGAHLESQLQSAKGGGVPLPDRVRAYMEPRFGADFSGVRLHADGQAAQLNRSLGAKAFTCGPDIYLGAGAEAPGTRAGNHLLAHELTHTVQQRTTPRIQGWWPKGHRLVTALAAQQGNLPKLYTPAAIKFLVDRSPDIDFIQDEFDTMNDGIKLAAPRLQLYEELIKSGQIAPARRMWEDNELHMRRKEYMLSHGEGGRYKEADAGGKNEAMTSRLVDKAAGLWQWNDYATWGKSLEKLGDALHQAEDRGSHGEGNAFTGHDVRLTVIKNKWWHTHKHKRQSWEVLPDHAPGDGWEPDNFDVNRKGGVLGVGFAVGVLGKFASDLGVTQNRPIDLGGAKKSEQPEKRKMKPKSWLPKTTSSSVGSHMVGKTGGGSKDLKKLFTGFMKARDMQTAYGEASSAPTEGHAPQEYTAQGGELEKGVNFYEQGKQSLEQGPDTLTDIMTRAYVHFNEWSKIGHKFGRGLSRELREKRVKEYYLSDLAKYQDNPEMQEKVEAALQAAHWAVFKYPIPKYV